MKIRVVVITAIILGLFNCFTLYALNGLTMKTLSIYVVQVGRYQNQQNADEMINNLKNNNLASYQYQNEDIIVINDIYLNQQEANEKAKAISELAITCVVKEYEVDLSLKQEIEKKEYNKVYEEIIND